MVRRLIAAGLCLLGGLSGCTVTDVKPVTPTRAGGSTPTVTSREAAEIPFDTSAVAAVVNSRVVLATRALGDIPFDGQVLPVFSPDGRFLATQTGEAPEWASLLAEPGQAVSMRTGVEAYDLSTTPPRRIRWVEDLPPGCLLGRSADDAGFLIERIMPDGNRRIGKVNWASGGVTWLTTVDVVSSSATLTGAGPRSAFVSTQRSSLSEHRGLLVRSGAGSDQRAEPGVSYQMPTATSDPNILLAMTQSTAGSDLVAIRLESASDASVRSIVLARRPVSSSSDPLVAYQAMSPLQSPMPLSPEAGDDQPPGVLFFHPSAGRMAVFEIASGAVTLLENQSIAGAWHVRRASGGEPVWSVFLTTPDGLKHQTLVRRGRVLEALPASSVSDEVWVPRATTDAVRPFILVGPSARDPRSLTLVEMRPVEPPR